MRACDEWANDFESFFRYVGVRPSSGHQIDRIDNDGNYEPGNVRWATRRQQSCNRRSSKKITYNGETKTLSELDNLLGVKYSALLSRLDNGWDAISALSQPINKLNNHSNRVLLNNQTGIFYFGAKEAAESLPYKISPEYLRRCILGKRTNKTPFVYV